MDKFEIEYFSESFEKYSEDEIKKMIKSDGKVLKDDSRSYVKLVVIDGKKIIIKKPREKNRRKWIRFITLFRESEVRLTLKTMDFLNKNGIKTNKPLVCLELKNHGMIFDSYAIYTYIDGDRIQEEDTKKTVEKLKEIHNLGYLHGDSQMRNFLKKDNEIFIIDSNLKKNRMAKIADNLEYLRLGADLKSIDNLLEKNTVSYIIAKKIFDIGKRYRLIKKQIRLKLGLRK